MSTRPTPPTRRRAVTTARHDVRHTARHGVRRRSRLLAAVLTVAAALALTGCHDGQGLRDEGPSGSSTVTGSGTPRGSAR
ncbi:hypothetical protein [Streptomyces humidus]|uniref:hypothetical protein n=1 Tax=Streptomyces humidus TaxID=52259 RepID=UPI00331A76C9